MADKKKGIHVAIIPDGNRRWAKKKGKPEWYGHVAGARKLRQVAEWCAKHPEIKTVTIYALSTENLQRDDKELNKLWEIYKNEFNRIKNSKDTEKKGLKIKVVGNSSMWRPDVKEAANEVMKTTKHYSNRMLNILLAYGSQFEIVNAMKKAAKASARKIPIVPKIFNRFLMVSEPVDLVIRTGGMHRLSNFLLFQAAYAEIYFSNTLWPDLSKEEFNRILNWYSKVQRKFGH